MTTELTNDVRTLSKWLNEDIAAPIDRQALARVLHALTQRPSAQEVGNPIAASLGDIVALWDQHAPSEYMTAIHMQAKRALAGQQPMSPDMARWCAYVGGMVAHWVKSDPDALARLGDDAFEAAIAGIIERRLWAMPKPAPQQATPEQQILASLQKLAAEQRPLDPEIADALRTGFWEMFDEQATPERVGEVVYQLQSGDGKWIDQTRTSYDYNVKHGNTVRVLYTRPAAAPAVPEGEVVADEVVELAAAMERRRILEAIKDVAASHPADDIPTPYQSAWHGACEEIFFLATDQQWHMDEDATRFPATRPAAAPDTVPRAALDELERERDYWRIQARTATQHNRGEAWYWQGDGGDRLESLTNSLPVVIRADQLRDLLAAAPAVPEGFDVQALTATGGGHKYPLIVVRDKSSQLGEDVFADEHPVIYGLLSAWLAAAQAKGAA